MLMPRKKKVDQKDTSAWFVIDLRQPYSFCGELLHSYIKRRSRGLDIPELFSTLSLKILGKLAYTTSAKVDIGIDVDITIRMCEPSDRDPISGFVEKTNDRLWFHIWLPDRIANHIHMTLMSSKTEVLQISGTELFWRKGDITGIDLLKTYDDDDYF